MTKREIDARILRRIIISLDDVMHFFVALILLACAGAVLVRSVTHLVDTSMAGILHTVNDVLLALIVLEILWPVVRFLKRAPFRLNPFLYVGIISSTRRILLIEAEHSVLSQISQRGLQGVDWKVPLELGINVCVILILAISIRLIGEKNDDVTH